MSLLTVPDSVWSLLRTALKFGVVGVLSIVVYFGFLFVFNQVVSQVWLLTGIAYIGSMVFNYFAQSMFTFNAKPKDLGIAQRYAWMQGGLMIFNSAVMYTLVDTLALNLWYSQLCVTVIIAGSSFLVSKFWVYRQS